MTTTELDAKRKKWISMKERLPEVDEAILITDGKSIVTASLEESYAGDGTPRLRWNGSGFGGYEWEFDFEDKDVTHWMELPELPQLTATGDQE